MGNPIFDKSDLIMSEYDIREIVSELRTMALEYRRKDLKLRLNFVKPPPNNEVKANELDDRADFIESGLDCFGDIPCVDTNKISLFARLRDAIYIIMPATLILPH